MDIVVLGIDLGKNVCSVLGLGAAGQVLVRRRMKRESVVAFTQRWPSSVVAMEACCGAHHLGRQLAAQGHTVRLISPEYGSSLRQGTEERRPGCRSGCRGGDAPNHALRRDQERSAVGHANAPSCSRTAGCGTHRANQSSSISSAGTRHRRSPGTPQGILADEALGLSTRIRELIADLREEWQTLNERITAFDAEFVSRARTDEAARRLATIPGIGSINATALVAAVGDGRAFKRGRDKAAWLGLVPRQRTTGGKPRLLGISKRGNRYLRKNLIHGARAVLPHLAQRDTPLGRWVQGLLARAHKNIVVVALANKLARIAWAVLAHGGPFDARHMANA
jgi:transposase